MNHAERAKEFLEEHSTCKECVHYKACKRAIKLHTELMDNKYQFGMDETKPCELFKPKSRFVELPCEVGQTVYSISETEIIEYIVHSIEFEKGGNVVVLDRVTYGDYVLLGNKVVYFDDFGKTVFLSREEAEKALSERSK